MNKEEQLDMWAQPPTDETKKIAKTYDLIQTALKDHFDCEAIKEKYSLSGFAFPEIFQQGSYANSTNVRFSSDLDIVFMSEDVFFYDTTFLSEAERSAHSRLTGNHPYKFEYFKQDVFEALKKAFGSSVELDDNCIKIVGEDGRQDADVVPCYEFRRYKRFTSHENKDDDAECGIRLISEDGDIVTNYPKLYLKNCKEKHDDTDENFKSVVRILKNMSLEMIEQSLIVEDLIKSFTIENLIYNCPNHRFKGNYADSVNEVLDFLLTESQAGRLSAFHCADEIDNLFDDERRTTTDAKEFIELVSNFYEQL